MIPFEVQIAPGLTVVHTRTRDRYMVTATGLMKVGDVPDWTPSVSYVRESDIVMNGFTTTLVTFTRDEPHFRAGFEVAS
jgi:hypothetical protein